MLRANVDEVDVDPVDTGDKLRQRIELRFRLAPVVAGSPVTYQLLKFRELDALGAVADSFTIGPARLRNAGAKIGERGFGHMNLEGTDRCVLRRSSGRRKHADECDISAAPSVTATLRAAFLEVCVTWLFSSTSCQPVRRKKSVSAATTTSGASSATQ